MTISRFRANVGRSTLRTSVTGTVRADTLSARANMSAILANYQKFVQHMVEVTPEILETALQEAFELSQVYVPKDTGALQKSGYLRIRNLRGRAEVEIGYGFGGEPDYAATVHENLRFKHKAPTRSKFLEAALNETENARHAQIIELLKYAGGV